MVDINDIFLIALWKFSDIQEEVINNKNYKLNEGTVKVALYVKGQELKKGTLLLLEKSNWYFLEVETSIMKDASAKELEEYVSNHIEEIKKTIFENEITNQSFYYESKPLIKNIKKITNEHIEDFLNK